MDQKRSPGGRPKRVCKSPEDSHWDCSVCTFKNPAGAFKCEMCDVRKGTSTRKPRLNSQVVAQQMAQILPDLQQAQPRRGERGGPPGLGGRGLYGSTSSSGSVNSHGHPTAKNRWPRLKNIDRNTGQEMAVTVNGITVIITDYKEKELNSALPLFSASSRTPSSSNSLDHAHLLLDQANTGHSDVDS